MFAIIKTGGKQYRIAVNDRIKVEKLDAAEGKKVSINEVLFVQKDGQAIFGEPLIKGASVEVEVLKNFKDEKIIIFKKRRRQNSRRKNGHRQQKTEIKILAINIK